MTSQDIAARLSAVLTGLGSKAQASFVITAYKSDLDIHASVMVYPEGVLKESISVHQKGAEDIGFLFSGIEGKLISTHQEHRQETIERLADDVFTFLTLYGNCHLNNLKTKNWDIHDVFKFQDAALDIVGRRLRMVGSPLTPTIIMPEPAPVPESEQTETDILAEDIRAQVYEEQNEWKSDKSGEASNG